MSEFTFIVNPSAGRGAAGRALQPLRKLLASRGISPEVLITTRPGEATQLARTAPGPYVIAFGGDGTVNEIANGLVGTDKSMGVIPVGSGNDFVKMIGGKEKIEGALRTVLAARTQKIDVGVVTCSGGDAPDSSTVGRVYFVNGVGLGFDAAVAAKTREIRYLSGTLLYVAAVFQMLGKYEAPLFQISTNGSVLSSRHLLIAIGNGTCAGGGFYLTPDAVIDDGLLDVCLIDDVSIPTILKLMPRVMRGKHTQAPQVKFLRTNDITFLGDTDFYVHADGEIVGRNVRKVHVQVLPKLLSVIMK